MPPARTLRKHLNALQILFAHRHPAQLMPPKLSAGKTDRTFRSGELMTLLSGANRPWSRSVEMWYGTAIQV